MERRLTYRWAPIMARRTLRHLPLAASTGVASKLTGLSGSALRRLAKSDATFPKPYTINDRGDLRWPVAEVVAWLEAKAGRQLAA
jgi:predicted DNA-binding transcriptional regulator AlpA